MVLEHSVRYLKKYRHVSKVEGHHVKTDQSISLLHALAQTKTKQSGVEWTSWPPARAWSTSASSPSSVCEMNDRAVPGLSALAVLQGWNTANTREDVKKKIPDPKVNGKHKGVATSPTFQPCECRTPQMRGNQSWWRWQHSGSPLLWRHRTPCLCSWTMHQLVTKLNRSFLLSK